MPATQRAPSSGAAVAMRGMLRILLSIWILALLASVSLPRLAEADCVGITLVGGRGRDYLVGGPCQDTLVGNDGDNVVTGGASRDRFAFSSGFGEAGSPLRVPSRPFWPTFGVTIITDFEPGVDTIELDTGTFTALESGVGPGFAAPYDFAVVDDDHSVDDAGTAIVYSRTSGTLFYDPEVCSDSANGIPFAIVVGHPPLGSADFAIVDWSVLEPEDVDADEEDPGPIPPTRDGPEVCASLRCAFARVFDEEACEDEDVPPRAERLGDKVVRLLQRLESVRGRQAARLGRRATASLIALRRVVNRSARGLRPKLLPACAVAIERVSNDVLAELRL